MSTNDDKWRKETQQKIKVQRDRIGVLIQNVKKMPKVPPLGSPKKGNGAG